MSSMDYFLKNVAKIALLFGAVIFFSHGLKVWWAEMYHGEKSIPGTVVKHINKEVPIKHGTETEFHLLVDFGKYGKHDLNVTTACYFDCVDGKQYYWKKNIYQMSDTAQDGWILVGFISWIIIGVLGIIVIVKFLTWVFDIKWD